MKIIVLKNNLLEGINSVERSIGSAANLPVLKNVLIKAEGGAIELTATNLEVASLYAVSGKVIESGSITIPGGIFGTVIKNLASERLTLESSDSSSLLITTDNYEATIQGTDASEFPIIPEVSNTISVSIPSPDFLDALGSVIVATQYSEIRPEISGVFVKFEDGKLTLVATDSFRLAEKTVPGVALKSGDAAAPFIIPLFSAEEILRVFKDSDGELLISIEQNQVAFSAGPKRFISRLVDGRFPDYQAIIPREFTREFSTDAKELASAIRLTSSFAGKTNDVLISSGSNGKFIDIACGDSSVGENHYRIPVKLTGDEFKLVFNWRYLLDGMKVLKGAEIYWGIVSPDRATLMKSKTDPSLIYIIMPIRRP